MPANVTIQSCRGQAGRAGGLRAGTYLQDGVELLRPLPIQLPVPAEVRPLHARDAARPPPSPSSPAGSCSHPWLQPLQPRPRACECRMRTQTPRRGRKMREMRAPPTCWGRIEGARHQQHKRARPYPRPGTARRECGGPASEPREGSERDRGPWHRVAPLKVRGTTEPPGGASEQMGEREGGQIPSLAVADRKYARNE